MRFPAVVGGWMCRSDLVLDPVPDVLVGVGPGDVHGCHDKVSEVIRIMGGVEGESRQDAAADVQVLVGNELSQRGLPPSSPEVIDGVVLALAGRVALIRQTVSRRRQAG
jgi:hypothetical protein